MKLKLSTEAGEKLVRRANESGRDLAASPTGMSEPIPVVYDCMIFLQAAARADRLHATMQLLHDGAVTLFVSPDVIAEVRDVLTRPGGTAKFPALSPQHVDLFLGDLLSRPKMVMAVPSVFSLPRDKKDEPFLNLDIEAKQCMCDADLSVAG